MIHDSPHLTIKDQNLLNRFLKRFSIDAEADKDHLISALSAAFSCIPYENLTKIIKSGSMVSPSSAMRYPDELISDYLKWGTGGTCFSLTAAIISVFNALGIEAHPVLANRHYGVDTHCGLVIVQSGTIKLLDPGYLLFVPTTVYHDKVSTVNTGTNTIELRPVSGGQKLELYTVYRGNRKLRLVYKIAPVDSFTFAKAWESSFAWEMMNYPVITSRVEGAQKYLQNKTLSLFSENGSKRISLSREEQMMCIAKEFAIDSQIINRAFLEIKKNGISTPTRPG
ncbi:hypothetical protein QA601_03935 [Chitinispirillales bacterium ANBcel5]|uniref:hypothetical protein n=1 Tax=Cellulosispirillum alkaliphilum TaxID=3039283 RepID=UPI002A4E4C00|nr:hypothetical protein [Chitinispirillales bacterium ANBcel5]